jgi:hypothetical protein
MTRMSVLGDRLLGEIASLDPVYVDGIAGAINLGTNFMLPFFRLIPVKTESGTIIMQRTPILLLVCPHSSLNDYGNIPGLVREQQSPLASGGPLLAH